MLPGSAILRVYARPFAGSKTAVGLDVSVPSLEDVFTACLCLEMIPMSIWIIVKGQRTKWVIPYLVKLRNETSSIGN